MKKFLLLAAGIWAFLVWHQHQAMQRFASGGSPVDSGTIVITYASNGELLEKLRKVKAGQRIDIRANGGGAAAPTGIQSINTDQKNASAKGQVQDQELRLIRVELARIEGPHE